MVGALRFTQNGSVGQIQPNCLLSVCAIVHVVVHVGFSLGHGSGGGRGGGGRGGRGIKMRSLCLGDVEALVPEPFWAVWLSRTGGT